MTPTKQFLGFAIGPIASGLIGISLVPLTAWLFAPADIGRLSMFQLSVSFFLLAALLGLDQSYVREYHGATNKPALLKQCATPGIFILLALFLVSSIFPGVLSDVIYGIKDPSLDFLTLLAVASLYVSRFLSLILRMQGRGLAFSVTQALPKALQLCFILAIGFLVAHRTLEHLLLAATAALIAGTAIFLFSTKHEWLTATRQPIVSAETRNLLRFGFPLIFSSLMYWALAAGGGISLRLFSNFSELALLSVATSFAGAATIVQAIFSLVWSPQVYKWEAAGADMRRINTIAQHASNVLLLVAAMIGALAWISELILPANYAEVKYLLPCCFIPPLFYTLSEITGIGISVARRTSLTIWVTLGALSVHAALSVALVPSDGARGAAIASALAFFVFFALRTEFSAAVWKGIDRRQIYGPAIAVVTLAIFNAVAGPSLSFDVSFLWMGALPFVALKVRPTIAAIRERYS